MGQTNRRPRDWCSKYYFFYTFYRLRALKTLYFYFCNFMKKNKKINWKDFCKEFCKKSWKRIILGTSDALLTIRLSNRPSNPAYHIVDWRISVPFVLLYCYILYSNGKLMKVAFSYFIFDISSDSWQAVCKRFLEVYFFVSHAI